MIEETLLLVTQVGMFLFIVAGMAAMGLSLTVPRIVEQLRDLRMVGLLLVANFVVVPAVAVVATRVLPSWSKARPWRPGTSPARSSCSCSSRSARASSSRCATRSSPTAS